MTTACIKREIAEGFMVRLEPVLACGAKYRKIGIHVHHGKNGKTKTIPDGRLSDGATGVPDLCGEGFFTHDEFCLDPYWDDGTPISNWGASMEYARILDRNGFNRSAIARCVGTCVLGGWLIKAKNGWFICWKNKG